MEKGTATHSSFLAWRIPWTEDLGSLPSIGSQRVGHNWTTNTFTSCNLLDRWAEDHLGFSYGAEPVLRSWNTRTCEEHVYSAKTFFTWSSVQHELCPHFNKLVYIYIQDNRHESWLTCSHSIKIIQWQNVGLSYNYDWAYDSKPGPGHNSRTKCIAQ